jgi:hypothetical protein
MAQRLPDRVPRPFSAALSEHRAALDAESAEHQRQRPQRVAELTAQMEAAERRDAFWRSWDQRRK